MIPSDVVSRIKLATELTTAPTAPTAKVKDALSDLIPGQRVLATIQALMPNGTYRAMVAQREVVLALPNSAKSGDTLELEVVENDGKIAFALLTNQDQSSEAAKTSVSTSLSKTGQLIGDLLNPPGKEGQKASPAPLNGNQPLVANFAGKGEELLPVLKQALTQSGMFYESHQAKWAEGKLPTAALLQEPQGQFSALSTHKAAQANPQINPFAEALLKPLPEAEVHVAQAQAPNLAAQLDNNPTQVRPHGESTAPPTLVVTDNTPRQGPAVAADLAPLVQQQLEALATQTYAWQGQVWPGQQMDWEITDELPGGQAAEDDYRWQTQLHLRMPKLGDVTATLRLRGENQIDLSIQTDSPDSEMVLSLGGPTLNQQMEDAGLFLAMFGVSRKAGTTP